jgi:uncharacterized surface protein with fasciclin (FAS1) repeats
MICQVEIRTLTEQKVIFIIRLRSQRQITPMSPSATRSAPKASAPQNPHRGSEKHPDLGTFHTFIRALKAADLVNVVAGRGPVTVFAVPDAGFAALLDDASSSLFADRERVGALIRRHIAPGLVTFAESDAAGRDGQVRTLGEQTLQLDVRAGQRYVNGVRVLYADLPASNGVVHVLEAPLGVRPRPSAL